MTTQDDDSGRKSALARQLAEETGITVVQAQNLIDMLGTNHGSLVREARILRRQAGKSQKS